MSEGAHFTCQGHASVLDIDPPTMYWESPLGTPLGVPHGRFLLSFWTFKWGFAV